MEADDDGNVVSEVVIVSTDIEEPDPVDFAKFRNADNTMPQTLDVMSDDGQAPSNDETADALEIDENEAEDRGRMMPSRTTTDGTLNYSHEEGDGLHAGTYNGAEGTFKCVNSANSCTVTFDADGMITAISDDWIFIPAKDAKSDQPDYEYLSYGFWLQRTTDEDGAVTYNEVETFATAHGMTASDAAGIGVVTGSATYEGSAVGVYVKNVLDSQANVVAARPVTSRRMSS